MVAENFDHDRRQCSLEESALWPRLNLSQQFAARSLSQFGYTLAFIRHPSPNESVVVMLSQDKVATIDDSGEIDVSSNIKIRK